MSHDMIHGGLLKVGTMSRGVYAWTLHVLLKVCECLLLLAARFPLDADNVILEFLQVRPLLINLLLQLHDLLKLTLTDRIILIRLLAFGKGILLAAKSGGARVSLAHAAGGYGEGSAGWNGCADGASHGRVDCETVHDDAGFGFGFELGLGGVGGSGAMR